MNVKISTLKSGIKSETLLYVEDDYFTPGVEFVFADTISDAIKNAAQAAVPQIQTLQAEWDQLTERINEAKANGDRLAMRDINARSIKLQNEITEILEIIRRAK